ncbi:MAG: hypothetical protein ABH881_04275 [bacterium]
MKLYFLKNWRGITVIILAIIFFVGTSFLNYKIFAFGENDFVKFNSPDENANYIFTKLYAQTGEFDIFEKYNLYAKDIMSPRSVRSDAGVLKPMSFLGMIIIYGKIACALGYKIIPYITPFLASLGLIFYFLFIKKFFGRDIAFISTLLLIFFPVFIYYTARSMFHNVPLIVFIIMGLYFGAEGSEDKKNEDDEPFFRWKTFFCFALSGIFFGLAIIARTSELIWIAPMLFIIWIINFKKIVFFRLIIFLSFLFLAMLPAFYHNQALYGSPLFGGYPEMNRAISDVVENSAALISSTAQGRLNSSWDQVIKIKNLIFYFGVHPLFSAKMVYYYFVKMFYWLFWPAVLGAIIYLMKIHKWEKKHWSYIMSFLAVSFILSLYYGSWVFHDNPDPHQYTIGNSYTRYWLPIYLGALPFVALAIAKTVSVSAKYIFKTDPPSLRFGVASKKIFIVICQAVLISAIIFLGIRFVLVGSEEGLLYLPEKMAGAKLESQKVLELTPSNAVVITKYHDKFLFPERKVIVGGFEDVNLVIEYANLAKHIPVYYFNFTLPDEHMRWLSDKRLKENGLGIEKIEEISSDFTLYKIFSL